jgi:hypothetical protein
MIFWRNWFGMFFANLKSHYLPWLFSVRNKKILTSLSIKGAIFLAECLLWETILYSLNKVLSKNKHNYRRRIRISLYILINSAQFAQQAFSSHLHFRTRQWFQTPSPMKPRPTFWIYKNLNSPRYDLIG